MTNKRLGYLPCHAAHCNSRFSARTFASSATVLASKGSFLLPLIREEDEGDNGLIILYPILLY